MQNKEIFWSLICNRTRTAFAQLLVNQPIDTICELNGFLATAEHILGPNNVCKMHSGEV